MKVERTEMNETAVGTKRLAQWVVGYMAVGPVAVAVDLAWHVFPDYPAIQLMRTSSGIAQSAWIACSLLAVITVILLRVKPRLGYVSLIALTAAYAPAYFAVWHQSTLSVYWVSLAAMGLATHGVFNGKRPAWMDGD